MGKIELLDCTLRDGGYVNDWEFGRDNLVSIFERLVDTNVDIIEVGFLDDRRPFDVNRSIFPDTEAAAKIWKDVNRKPPMIVGMIDFGTCSIENLQPCEESFLDGIRVIFKKGKMYAAMEYCKKIKDLGYKVFSQLVSITSYSDDELRELISLVNEVRPYAVSMVDTYGLLDPPKLNHYYDILDKEVIPEIGIGFHAHNNFQLAYANCRAFLEKKVERNILVDGTLFGMGKSAGNAPLELLGKHLNEDYGCDYNISPMLVAIEESIKDFYVKSPWGYKTFFYVCATTECHPSYLQFFQEKGNLSPSKLLELLSRIEPEDKKLLYDKELAEKIYGDYIEETMCDDLVLVKLSKELEGKDILVVGPGKNVLLQKLKVDEYINTNNPLVIAINYIPDNITPDFVFLTKTNRYKEITNRLKSVNTKIIATTNLESRDGKFEYIVDRKPLLEVDETIKDNSFLMLLNILKRCGIEKVSCAGLDGYSDKEDNYVSPRMEYDFVKKEAIGLNRHVKNVLNTIYKDIEISFVTYSHYRECDSSSGELF